MILTYLIAASLPLGYFPSEELLTEFDLGEQYENILPALQVRFLRISALKHCFAFLEAADTCRHLLHSWATS